jgi:hypothetical protein
MTLKKYTISVTESQYWQEIHDLLCSPTSCEHIPDREVSCHDEKDHSPTRGTFILNENEAESLKNHPHISWVELDPTEYPEEYPKPSPYIKRWGKQVKVYRDLGSSVPVTSGIASIGELDRTGWQIIRPGINTAGDFWGTSTGESIGPVSADVSYSLTGKNVDVIIHDSGVLQYHPEFLDENGQSRVRDVILDGPYYIDQQYFDNVIPGVKYTKPDGRVGIATTAVSEWWSNSAKRSAGFSTIGTLSVPVDYTVQNTIGSGGTSHNLGSGHGTCCASLVGGKNFGLAFEVNIWNMCGIGDNTSITIEQNYDFMKLFHMYKPINPVTGKKNPTVVNGSWGYQAAFSSANTVTYRFRDTTGTFIGNAATTDQVTAMKNGLNNQVAGAIESWSASSRSSSTDQAALEMMDTGVIYVCAAGNNNQRLGVGSTDPDLLNYMSDNWFGTTDPRSHFPSNCVPCNHRNWMNPQGIGFNSTTDAEFHPVVCVGAMEDSISAVTLPRGETKASYSNNGPGIDVWAPADETLAAGLPNNGSGYNDFRRYDNSLHFDNNFNGTSAAAPVACGLVCLYMETNPTANSRTVKAWLKKHGSKNIGTSLYLDQYPDDTTTLYWTASFNMRGAETRILYNPFANDTKPTMSGIQISGISLSL